MLAHTSVPTDARLIQIAPWWTPRAEGGVLTALGACGSVVVDGPPTRDQVGPKQEGARGPMQEVLYSPGHQATWHHYLHGDQSDEAVGWLCRPERRPILVNSEHLRHLQELLDVYAGVTIADRPALSVANLSQSDPNLQAGQGALCVAVHLRVPAEEGTPPRVGHGLLTVKRQLQPAALGETLRTLTKLSGVLAPSGERGLEDAYLGFWWPSPPKRPAPPGSTTSAPLTRSCPVAPISDPEHEWIPQSDARMPERIAVLGRGPDDHGRILEVMAGLASVLYQSSVRWGELTTSRRVPADREGLVIQLLADSEPAALVERAVPLVELEGEVEDWITKLLPLRRTRIESASPFTDQSWSTSRRREVVNVPEINRPKPQRERLDLPRERVELPSTPTPEPRQRPRSAVDAVELPLRAPGSSAARGPRRRLPRCSARCPWTPRCRSHLCPSRCRRPRPCRRRTLMSCPSRRRCARPGTARSRCRSPRRRRW
jgi:hypothetical protein